MLDNLNFKQKALKMEMRTYRKTINDFEFKKSFKLNTSGMMI
jgi:hypothetical protein